MKRRDFLKTSAVAAGFLGSLQVPTALGAEGGSGKTGTPAKDNRPAEYLRRAQAEPFLPKPPVPGKSPLISPMPLEERLKRKIVPQKGFCSIAPAENPAECLITGNGAMNIELMGDPYSEKLLFHHESLLIPWKRPLEAPNVADIFAQVRQMVLDGKHGEAMALALQRMSEGPIKPDTQPHLTVPAFLMQLEAPKAASVKDYLRAVDFETGEATVHWTVESGAWTRQTFVSRPDNIAVQRLAAPAGGRVNVKISLLKSAEWTQSSSMDWGSHLGIGATSPDREAFLTAAAAQKALAPKGVEACEVRQDISDEHLIYKCRLDPSVDNSGYAGVVRVVRSGGSARVEQGTLVVENAASVLLLTRIEYFADFSEDKVEKLRQAVDALAADYSALLDRHRKAQSEALNRVSADFGGASQHGMAVEELLADQRARPDYSPALLESVFAMGRYWFIINSGKYPSIAAEINSTINLQTAGAIQGGLREGMEAYFNWMESLVPDCRANAKNIFGCRGASYPLFPDKGVGANFYYTGNNVIGIWPYWISAGGWLLRQFWDYYLTTGDLEFLRNRVVPAYKELALFYEDFLTVADKNGNYIFAPSISPENAPVSATPTGPAMVNATIDIAVCRETLSNLIQACETLGSDADSVAKWKGMLAKMPPYLLEPDGTLKEWAWPTLEEHYNHRHVSHLYGAWPGDEFDPDRTPQLARAALIADRRRKFDTLATAVAGETLAAYTRCHRALVGARLKDNVIVDVQLRQLMEQGYVSTALRCSREPYAVPVPDAHGGIPAIIMEMLAYSRPGVIEALPALPPSLPKGSVNGMRLRTFATLDKLAWNMEARTVDLTITSLKKQDITLIARQGIEDISVSDGILTAKPKNGSGSCELLLPEGKPVKVHLKLGQGKPMDWVARVS